MYGDGGRCEGSIVIRDPFDLINEGCAQEVSKGDGECTVSCLVEFMFAKEECRSYFICD